MSWAEAVIKMSSHVVKPRIGDYSTIILLKISYETPRCTAPAFDSLIFWALLALSWGMRCGIQKSFWPDLVLIINLQESHPRSHCYGCHFVSGQADQKAFSKQHYTFPSRPRLHDRQVYAQTHPHRG